MEPLKFGLQLGGIALLSIGLLFVAYWKLSEIATKKLKSSRSDAVPDRDI